MYLLACGPIMVAGLLDLSSLHRCWWTYQRHLSIFRSQPALSAFHDSFFHFTDIPSITPQSAMYNRMAPKPGKPSCTPPPPSKPKKPKKSASSISSATSKTPPQPPSPPASAPNSPPSAVSNRASPTSNATSPTSPRVRCRSTTRSCTVCRTR